MIDAAALPCCLRHLFATLPVQVAAESLFNQKGQYAVHATCLTGATQALEDGSQASSFQERQMQNCARLPQPASWCHAT